MKLPFVKRERGPQVAPATPAAAPAEPAERGSGWSWLGLLLPLVLVALVVATIVVFYESAVRRAEDAKQLTILDNQAVLTQALAKEAALARTGDEQAFRRLKAASRAFDTGLGQLLNGDPSVPVKALPDAPGVRGSLASLQAGWTPLAGHVEAVLAARPALLNLQAAVADFQTLKQLALDALDLFNAALLDAYAPPAQVASATRLYARVEEIGDGMYRTLLGGAGAPVAAERFQRAAQAARAQLTGYANGDPVLGVDQVEDPAARERLSALTRQFAGLHALTTQAGSHAERALALQAAIDALLAGAEANGVRVAGVREAFVAATAARPINNTLGVALGAGAIVVLILFGIQLTAASRRRADEARFAAAEARRREEESRQLNQANQDAIARLLDEISDLADGDLTINATVTENITGAIAEAINYSIEALRETVANINGVSVQMASAARQSRETAARLTQETETQSTQIEGAAASVRELAAAASSVSTDAARGLEVARQAVDSANDGATVVRATIDGMDAIRENIQETSKRIKRLGESSQEIGDIVGLIDDIADQTNILALNAAIAASMAGEQGRGFAVVADEVQRLAERAGQATKQIEGLVKAIQSDTNEAVASMEQSTAGVVSGAELAEGAGRALVRIEIVSQELAGLVTSISESAVGQTQQAAQVAQIMAQIQAITLRTRAGTENTARAVSALAQLAVDLRTSVAGFKLPEVMSTAVGGLPPAPATQAAPAA